MDYAKLYKDIKNGKGPVDVTLVMDNDGGYWEYTGKDEVNEDETHPKVIECEKKYGIPSGYSDIVDILIASGVEASWC